MTNASLCHCRGYRVATWPYMALVFRDDLNRDLRRKVYDGMCGYCVVLVWYNFNGIFIVIQWDINGIYHIIHNSIYIYIVFLNILVYLLYMFHGILMRYTSLFLSTSVSRCFLCWALFGSFSSELPTSTWVPQGCSCIRTFGASDGATFTERLAWC